MSSPAHNTRLQTRLRAASPPKPGLAMRAPSQKKQRMARVAVAAAEHVSPRKAKCVRKCFRKSSRTCDADSSSSSSSEDDDDDRPAYVIRTDLITGEEYAIAETDKRTIEKLLRAPASPGRILKRKNKCALFRGTVGGEEWNKWMNTPCPQFASRKSPRHAKTPKYAVMTPYSELLSRK